MLEFVKKTNIPVVTTLLGLVGFQVRMSCGWECQAIMGLTQQIKHFKTQILLGFSFATVQHYLFLILTIGALHLLISAPLALLACISRGYLVPIGFAFTTLMLALVFGPTAIGAYLPWSVPALHLKENGVASFPLVGISYFLVFLIGLTGFIGTVKWLQSREQR
ncbi:hypothetical protein [Paenibacillus sp. FSL H7-0331]|uniref:hypothetical protein n=1 Tax=Paenibacillus sp. FSL H7-0331 TaxID=1920421 RepID=UPI00211634EF|nr:hypothetical protein [Paenibacillus sp. FSL H7-0331]